MLLTEDRDYVLSLDHEDGVSETGLTNNMVELEFSGRELLHAVVTCGMPIQRLTPAYMRTRKMEILYKIFLVETALEAEGDRLQKSKSTAYLDSSEKSVISYYLGMFFTKLISRKMYHVDHLTHLNLIRRTSGDGFIDFFGSEWRPEMIGYSVAKDSWSVWEAKGGSNMRVQALQKGAKQLEAIASVNGKQPDPPAVCMTYYEHGYLSAIIRKPAESVTGAVKAKESLDISVENFYRAYYQPILELFQEQGMRIVGKDVEITLPIPDFAGTGAGHTGRSICIGMPITLLECLADERCGMARKISDVQERFIDDGRYVGADGIYIR